MNRMTIIAIITVLTLVILYVGSIFVQPFFYAHGYDKKTIVGKLIIGHRGGAGIGAENSLTCLKRGIDTGADMIEIDLHQTRDSVIVVNHDPTVNRTTNGSGTIAKMTYEEISRLRIVNKDGEVTDDHVATFEEVLELFADVRSKGQDVKLLVEIKYPFKNAYNGIEKRMLDLINAHNAKSWVVIQSFADDVIEKVHELDHTIRVEKLLICKLPFLPYIVDGMRITSFSYEKYHYVSSFNFYYLGLSHSMIADIHRQGKEVKMWTIEELDAPLMDVDGIITDRPDIWCKERK
ncbi:MAG: hypothetical protein LUD00_09475 [Prevotellaceae bacterium]|nr:hypothetical protein [Prevotellaceae bacterium]